MKRSNGFYPIDGDNYTSVTTVLDSIAKPALVQWAAKMGARCALRDNTITEDDATYMIYQFKEEASDRGNFVHKYAQHYGTPQQIKLTDVPEELRGYCRAYEDWVKTHKPEYLYRELTLYNKTHQYAGTTDIIAKIGEHVHVIDIKTGKYIYDTTSLQLSAYHNAEFMIDNGKHSPMIPINRTSVLLLGADGSFTFKTVTADLEVFLAAQKIWVWQNKNKYETRNMPIEKGVKR